MVFSIIVPVYNVSKYLHRCLESIIDQTFKDIEIILVDDGSTDESGDICDQFSKKDTRISVIHKKNGGLSSARNAGLEIASGDYVIFVDSDDYIDKTSCERFLPFIEKNPDVIVADCLTTVSGYADKHSKNINIGMIYDGLNYLQISLKDSKFPVMAWLNVYKMSFLLQNSLNFFDGILHEDIDFTFRLFLLNPKTIYSNVTFYHYVINDYSITSKKDKRKNCSDIYNTCLRISTMVNNIKIDKSLKKMICGFLCECYMGIFRNGDLYRYKNLIHKKYVLSNFFNVKNKYKVLLFSFSPHLFCKLRKER